MPATTITNYSFISTFKKYVNSSVILILCTILALICANIPVVKDWYFSLWQHPVSLSIGNFNFFSHNGHTMNVGQVINDFLMAIFFLSVGLEIKREIRVGELSTREKALLPIIGACGGMAIPVVIFWLVCPGDPVMQRGLAIPMATDIAFSIGILTLLGKRVPLNLKIFLTALAIVDDLGAVLVIAIFYTTEIQWVYLLSGLALIGVLMILNRRHYKKLHIFLVIGMVVWWLFLQSGIHATIAGVLVAFTIPMRTHVKSTAFVEGISETLHKFDNIKEQFNIS